MSDIEWTDTTWSPVVGCTPVSPGCLNCYAATMARRLEAMGKPEYAPRMEDDSGRVHRGAIPDCKRQELRTIRIAEVRGGRAVFTGDVRCLPDRLEQPLHWRKPRMVFVNSMSDLFHEDVPFDFIDRVFAVMALCPQHTFQVLTKRPERMAEYLSTRSGAIGFWETGARSVGYTLQFDHGGTYGLCPFPLPSVWHGTSCEDQARADERIPHLLRCPAAVRFLSCEPLLGPIDLRGWLTGPLSDTPGRIHWVIVGGESGPSARPNNVAWTESIVDQCRDAGVACFLKQMGSKPYVDAERGDAVRAWGDAKIRVNGDYVQIHLRNRKGGDPSEWPEHLRVRQFPEGSADTP